MQTQIEFDWIKNKADLHNRIYAMDLEKVYLLLRNAGLTPIEMFDNDARDWLIELVWDGHIKEYEVIEELG